MSQTSGIAARARAFFFDRLGLWPAAVALILFAAFNVRVVPSLAKRIDEEGKGDSVRRHAKMLERTDPEKFDSWYPMFAAYEHLYANPAEKLYDAVFFQGGVKFQYPPSSLILVKLLEAIHPQPSVEARQSGDLLGKARSTWVWRLDQATRLATYATMALSAALLLFGLASARGFRRDAPSDWASLAIAGAAAWWLASNYYPSLKAFSLRQVQPFLALAFAAAVIAARFGAMEVAGALMGLSCLFKPQMGIVLIWGLIRKQWRFCAAMGVALAIGLGYSIATWGIQAHLDYLRVVSFISKHGESFHPNQSVNGLLNRWLGNGNNATWEGDAFPVFDPIVYGATLLTSLLLIGGALWPNKEREAGADAPVDAAKERERRALDFALAGLAATIASPVAWEHHYSVLPPIYALLLPALIAPGAEKPGRSAALLALSFLLTSQLFTFTLRLADTAYNPLQSYCLAGGLVLYGLLAKARGGRTQGGGSSG